MIIDHAYVGCDVSKRTLDVFDPAVGKVRRFAGDEAGIARLAGSLEGRSVFVVLEATGVYDRALRYGLAAAGIPFARVNPLHAKRFAQASGRRAKTDALDARMLAQYGERLRPPACPAPDPVRDRLCDLHRRRDQLVAMRAAELTQAKDALCKEVVRCHEEAIAFLTEKIGRMDALIEDAIASDPRLAEDRALLGTAPGVGPVTEAILLCLMPELGSLTPKTAPALAGIVPYDHSSGLLKGHKKIAGGRRRVRRALFIAALSATRCSARYKAIYEGLRRRGKAHKQATIAVARHLLCALNAMLRDRAPYAA